MAEVPEHLLQRSRARRAALGLGGGEEGQAPAAPSGAVEKAAPASAPAPAATGAAPARPAAPVAPAPTAPPPPPPVKQRVPTWVMPALVILPFWAVIYSGAFGERGGEELTPVQQGQQLYLAQGCGGCHGASGGGGVGPALSGNEVETTFPDPADHANWIKVGSNGIGLGNVYGDPDRPGGARVVQGGMPAFSNLSDEEIELIVLYEREGL